MIEKVTVTTDGKFIGMLIDTTSPVFLSPDGVVFDVAKMQNLGNGKWRYSNSHYVVETIEVSNG